MPAAAVFYYAVTLLRAYRALPAEVPVHFGLDGSPNGWMNRTLWLVLSPIMLSGLLVLVLSVRTAGAGAIAPPAALIFWAAMGLVSGAFIQIVQSAQHDARFRLVPMLIWAVCMPLLEILTMWLTRSWWTRS